MIYYANRIGVMKNSNDVVLHTDNGSSKSGRYIIIDKDVEDEYIKRNTKQEVKNRVVAYLSAASALGLGILTYAKVKSGHIGKSLAGMAVAAAGLVGAYKLINKYENSSKHKIDNEFGATPVSDVELTFNPDFKRKKKISPVEVI